MRKIIYLFLWISLFVFSACGSTAERPVVNCSDFGESFVWYNASDLGLSFCYLSDWGSVSFKNANAFSPVKSGEAFNIAFSDLGTPFIFVGTKDFAFADDALNDFCWECMDLSLRDEELISGLWPSSGDYDSFVDTSLERFHGKGSDGVFVITTHVRCMNPDLSCDTEFDGIENGWTSYNWYFPGVLAEDNYNVSVRVSENIAMNSAEIVQNFVRSISFKD